jgi:hypothetical protein
MLLTLLAAGVLTALEPSSAALAPRFVQVQQALPGEQPTAYDGWTKAQLEAEVERLEDLRPSKVGPVIMVITGAVVGGFDLAVFLLGGFLVTIVGGSFDTGTIAGMSVFGVIAVGLLIVGGILLKRISAERSEYDRQIAEVTAAIERLVTPAPMEPPPNVPPAMPHFPQVMAPSAPTITLTLARF